MFRIFRNWRHYFFPTIRKPDHVPRQFVSHYDMINASRDERILMEANLARSPQEARLLMARYGCTRAVEVMRRMPHKRGTTLRERFERLVMRWQGATLNEPRARRPPSAVRVKYSYRQ